MTLILNGTSGITDVNGTAAAPAITGTDTDTGVFFGTNTVSLSTGGTERLQVDSSGNLGLGVTPSAWGSGYKALDIQYLGISNTGAGTVDCSFTQNGYYNGTNWIAKYTSPSKRYSISDSGFIWYNGASATAGNAITFTQAMTLDASGNLLLGTTSGTGKLVVSDATDPVIRLQNTKNGSWTAGDPFGELYFYSSDTSGAGAGDRAFIKSITADAFGASSAMSFGIAESGGNATEKMRIDQSGNLLVGTTTALSKIAVFGSGSQRLSLVSPTGSTTQVGINLSPSMTEAEAAANPAQAAIYATDSSYSANIIFANKATGAIGNALTERARINSGGNLLINNTNDSIASGGIILRGSGESFCAITTGNNTLHVYSTSASVYRFYVSAAGQINATSTSITAISDQSLKENIRDLETGLTEVMALQPRRFDWKEETGLEEKNVAGFIAQELEQVLPDLVYEYQYNETETKKAIKMGDILPTLVKAIQEQQAIITQLQADVAALKGQA